jgi:hypothetical protein
MSTEAEDTVQIPHQATTGENTADCEDLVNYRVCQLAIAIQLFVFTSSKCSINPITNPHPVYSYSEHQSLPQWKQIIPITQTDQLMLLVK